MTSDTYNSIPPLSSYSRLIANILAIIGAINWGLIGIFKFDLVAFLFDEMSTGSRAVYTLVGLAGLYLLIILVQRAISNQ